MKKPTPAKEILEAIKEEAIHLWGKNWFAELVRAYCEVEGEVTGTTPMPKTRRSQLERAFEVGGTSLETVIWLTACVNGELQLVFHRVEIKKF